MFFFSFLFFSSLSPLLFSSCAHFFFALKGMIAGFFFHFCFLFFSLSCAGWGGGVQEVCNVQQDQLLFLLRWLGTRNGKKEEEFWIHMEIVVNCE
jgi:hypothetical protein